MSVTTDKGTTRAAAARERAERAAAAQTPRSSPRIKGVDQEHPVRKARQAADAARQAGGLGKPGQPLNSRSPFMIGMNGAAGVAVTYGVVELLLKAHSVLILIGLAFFIAAGLDPVVVWLTRHGLRRWAAVTVVVFALFAFVGGFVAAAIPPVVAQTSTL
ncbi:MAG: hypothetical protein JWM19_584, partial [Actinomycetia bacterium]|nr:hypothetical protein [Actinomycetes bacterium]